MKSCLRIIGALIIGLFVSALISNGGTSLNPIAKPAHAQLTDLQINNLFTTLQGLPPTSQQLLTNISPAAFQDLSSLSSSQLSNLVSLDLSTITGFPGLSNSTVSALQALPETALDNLLGGLSLGELGNLGNTTSAMLGQFENFLDIGALTGINPNSILSQFDSLIPGNLNTILNTANLFQNFDISNLNTIAGNLGVNFGDFAGDIAGALNINVDQLINLDISELAGLGVGNLGDLLGTLGLPNSALNTLAGNLGTTVANLLNVDLNNLNLVGINSLSDLSGLIGINPSTFLNDLVTNLGVNPSAFLNDLTGAVGLNLDDLLSLDLNALSGLGINNINDLAGLLGLDPNTLLGNLSSALNIPITDLANLNLDTLIGSLNLPNIGQLADMIGLNADNLLNDLSGALGIPIGNFTDISIATLANLGLNNIFDLSTALGTSIIDISNILGISPDVLLGTSITDLAASLGVTTLGGIAGAIGITTPDAITAVVGSVGVVITVGGGVLTITFVPGTFTPTSTTCSSGFCTGNNECDCNGWCFGTGCSPTPGASGCNCRLARTICDHYPEYHVNVTRPYWDIEMYYLERWLVTDFFAGYILPSMMAMTEELTTVAMQQTVVLGSFFDAKLELETHRLLQEIQAQAHKDYHPSEGVCVYATNVRGLAMTERLQDINQSILSTRATDRHLGIQNDNAALDPKSDLGTTFTSRVTPAPAYRGGRLRQFQDEFCNPRDNNEYMRFMCGNGGAGAPEAERVNSDIDYIDNFAIDKTLSINFLETDDERTPEERARVFDYFAMTKNLYGHRVPVRLSTADLNVPASFMEDIENYQNNPYTKYLNMRAMQAKRSVAENSFHAQTAMKAESEGAALGYMSSILTELGMDTQSINEFLKGGPSYYAQMEILTKKIYQNPQFYVDLYDKPANVKRKQVALRAINLMQDWDTYEVQLRSEMLASILLELSIIEKQNKEQNN